MSNRVYNTNNVVDKIGLKNQISYDKIDVFVDTSNKNNIWAKIEYTNFNEKKPQSRQKNIRFANYQEMVNYIYNHFDTYELNHQVDYLKRKIFFHSVDYLKIDYYLHENRPNLNYLELSYKEYVNGDYHIKKITLPKEEDKMFEEIVKINKKMPLNAKLPHEIYQTIEVYKERTKRMDKEIKEEEKRERNKVRHHQKVGIKNLKPLAPVVAFVVLFTSGYTVVKNTVYKEDADIVTQKEFALSVKDVKIWQGESRAASIIDAMMDNNYSGITIDDLKYVTDYFKTIESSNYDRNNSTTSFNYVDYFSDKIFMNTNEKSIAKSKMVLGKIETLYNNCFVNMGDEVFVNQNAVNEYINYVASLTFMYDTTVDARGSHNVPLNTQSIISKYATKEEVEQYNSYPLILKYIILNQLKSMLIHSQYQVKVKPSNYFESLDKEDLISNVASKIENVLDELKRNCHTSKSI